MKRVFLSVGRAESDQQKQFVAEIEKVLKLSGLEPRRAAYSSVQPLKKIVEELETCDGAVVIAFERLHADRAVEFKQTPKEKKIRPLRATTVWNHIEAGMAYSLGRPILIVAEKGCSADGMLGDVSEWKVCWVELDPSEFHSDRFQAILADWRQRMEEYERESPKLDVDRLSQLTVMELMRSVRPAHMVALSSAIAGVFAVGLAIGRFFP